MPKIVIASDSFKGSLSSSEVAAAAEEGIRKVIPGCEVVKMSIADGGEGTSHILAVAMNARRREADVTGPSGIKIRAEYFIEEVSGTSIIETAAASGLMLVSPQERNPLFTSTFGTGELIKDAAMQGCRRHIVGLGGSATNDAGTGMLEALGFRFIDKNGKPLKGMCGDRLKEVARIGTEGVCKEIAESEFIIACDVDTVFCGPHGATRVFSPQKGATPQMVEELEEGMMSFAQVIRDMTGTDLSVMEGSGAAGGLAGAFMALLDARKRRGIDLVLDMTGFDKAVEGASLIITGEGRLDEQTGKGKAAAGVAERARTAGIPVIAIAGISDLREGEHDFTGVFPIGPRPENESDLAKAMNCEVAYEAVKSTVAKALESLSPFLFHESL